MEQVLECSHGEPRGERYCALCRFEKRTRPEIGRSVVAVHANAQETSRIAAARALPSSGTKRRITYDLIASYGALGLCDHELEIQTGWLHQSASAARNTLLKDGLIKDSGLRRNTPQGNPAIVWITA